MKKEYKKPTMNVVMLQQSAMLMGSQVNQTSSNLDSSDAISVADTPGSGQGRSRQSTFDDWDEE